MPRLLRFALVFGLVWHGLCFAQLSPASTPSHPQTSVTAQPALSATPAPATPSSSADPASPVPNPLGEAHADYRKGDLENALAKYQEILRDHPRSPDAYAGLIRVYLKQKRVDFDYDAKRWR